MIDILGDLVTQLTAEHVDTRSGQRMPPLLAQLRTAFHSSLGKTHDGHSAAFERSVMNLEAFTIYEDLDGKIAALWLMATETGRLRGSPEANLQGWYLAFSAAWGFGEVTNAQVLLALTRLNGYVRRIEDLFDPPMVWEILAPCPDCRTRHFVGSGVQTSALYVSYRRGSELVGSCRACHATWSGDAQLVGLAKAIGATIDVDALRVARAPSRIHG
jgi:hypothetical protein